MTLTPEQKPPLMGSSGGGVIHRRRTDRQLEFHAFRTVPGLEAEFVCCLGAGTTDGEWSSRRSISVSSLRQGPIRCVARVERCCWTTSAQTTPCGYGSRLTCQTSRRHCERSEAIHREAKKKAGLLRCARMRKQVAFVVGPAVIPAKAGIQYAAACRLIISSSAILDRPPSRAMTRRVTFACAPMRKRFAFVAAITR